MSLVTFVRFEGCLATPPPAVRKGRAIQLPWSPASALRTAQKRPGDVRDPDSASGSQRFRVLSHAALGPSRHRREIALTLTGVATVRSEDAVPAGHGRGNVRTDGIPKGLRFSELPSRRVPLGSGVGVAQGPEIRAAPNAVGHGLIELGRVSLETAERPGGASAAGVASLPRFRRGGRLGHSQDGLSNVKEEVEGVTNPRRVVAKRAENPSPAMLSVRGWAEAKRGADALAE